MTDGHLCCLADEITQETVHPGQTLCLHCGHMGPPFEGPGPHGDLIQFLGPHFCSKVPIFYIQAHERVKSPCSHYLMSIIRLFVITLLALMNPMPVCQFYHRTIFPPFKGLISTNSTKLACFDQF